MGPSGTTELEIAFGVFFFFFFLLSLKLAVVDKALKASEVIV